MKKNQTSKQKLKLSRQTLRHLEAGQLVPVVGGTITYPPCYPSLESICNQTE
jgi:hypothetical protein